MQVDSTRLTRPFRGSLQDQSSFCLPVLSSRAQGFDFHGCKVMTMIMQIHPRSRQENEQNYKRKRQKEAKASGLSFRKVFQAVPNQ